MAKLGLGNISRFLFGRPLDKIDRHILKYSLELFLAAEIGFSFSRYLFPLSPDFQLLLFLGISFYLAREIHSHAYYHYLRNSLGRE